MNSLYLECYSGISGDMLAGALLDLGGDQKKLEDVLDSIPDNGFSVQIRNVKKNGIDACDFCVVLDETHENHDHDMNYLYGKERRPEGRPERRPCPPPPGSDPWRDPGRRPYPPAPYGVCPDPYPPHGWYDAPPCPPPYGQHDPYGPHDPYGDGYFMPGDPYDAHGWDACGDPDEEHHHEHTHGHHHEHRNLSQVYEIIDQVKMTENARALAKKIFRIVAEAEASVHGKPIEEVHFHEVGAIDSIVDIIAIAVLFDDVKEKEGFEDVIVPVLYEGTGQVRCQHGVLPIPVPATAAIAEAYSIRLHVMDDWGEFVTPTGAASVAAIRTKETFPESFTIQKTGLGAGKRNYPGHTGMVRAMLIQ